MAQFVAQVLVLASLYALVGAGFPLIYRSSRILNLAHGELVMLGGYILLLAVPLTGGTAWLGVILSVVVAFLLGLGIYFVLMRPVIGQPILAPIMLTIGLSIMLRGAAILIWTPAHRNLAQTLGAANDPHLLFAGINLSTYDLATIAAGVAFVAAILLFLRWSRVGIQMRAAGENALLASQRGINIYVMFALAWSIAIVGATLGGILYGANNRLDPDIGFVGLKALAVPLVGGMDSVAGIIPAALVVAFAEFFVARYVDSALSDVIPMVIMLLVLIVRPWGFFGTKEELERV